jgi:hypothetical protein
LSYPGIVLDAVGFKFQTRSAAITPPPKGCNMKKYGKKKLQGKNRKNPTNPKSMYRESGLAAMGLILRVLAFYDKVNEVDLKYSLAQALLDRLTPEVPSAEAFAFWVVDHIAGHLWAPVSELPQFSADSH